MARAASLTRNAHNEPTSSISTSRRNGARRRASAKSSSNCGNAGRRACLDRPGRDRIHADAARAELGGEIADGGLERGLDGAHHAVSRHHFPAPRYVMVSSVPPWSISGSASRAMRMNEWHETSIALAKPSRDTSATRPCRSRGGAKRNRMQQEVETAPALADRVEDGFECARLLDVELHHDGRSELPRQRLDVGARFVVDPRQRELCATAAEHARAAIGDAVVVGNADHQAFAAAGAAIAIARRRSFRVCAAMDGLYADGRLVWKPMVRRASA